MAPISLSGKIEIGAIMNLLLVLFLFCLSPGFDWFIVSARFNVWTIILRLWRPVLRLIKAEPGVVSDIIFVILGYLILVITTCCHFLGELFSFFFFKIRGHAKNTGNYCAC